MEKEPKNRITRLADKLASRLRQRNETHRNERYAVVDLLHTSETFLTESEIRTILGLSMGRAMQVLDKLYADDSIVMRAIGPQGTATFSIEDCPRMLNWSSPTPVVEQLEAIGIDRRQLVDVENPFPAPCYTLRRHGGYGEGLQAAPAPQPGSIAQHTGHMALQEPTE